MLFINKIFPLQLAQYLIELFQKLFNMTPDKNFPQPNNDPKKDPVDEQLHTHEAFEQAEEDIGKDPEMKPDKNEDLDEGELARKEGHP